MLQTGDMLPEAILLGPDDHEISLRDLLGTKTLVIYFYPKDDTMVCTAQACGFRDQYEDFIEAGADVIGISSDPPASHRDFVAKHRLPFTLLSDLRGEARAAFGVGKSLGLLPGRVTFVVDAGGTIRYAFSSQLRAQAHVQGALEVVRSLRGQKPNHSFA